MYCTLQNIVLLTFSTIFDDSSKDFLLRTGNIGLQNEALKDVDVDITTVDVESSCLPADSCS